MIEQNPYQTPATNIENQQPTTGTELAHRGIRLLAAILDGLILMLFIIPLQISMGIFKGFPGQMVEPDLKITLLVGVAGFLMYALINGYTLFKNGQTIGKLICKIKIVRTDFTRVTLKRVIFMRYLSVSIMAQIPVIGVIIVGFLDPLLIFRTSKQCLHDSIADTVVIKI